ncbi:MAG: response regulator [Candidatus Omnitrophica bacterium]|nr:response regulator [Candidatus Omnitrophota bacterium]
MTAPTTLLIVDDEPEVLETLQAYLETRGYKVFGAAWAEDAVRAYQKERPQLVLLDIQLPDSSGFEVLRKIRAADPKAQVVVMTAIHDLSLRQEAFSLGAAAFAFKPMEVTSLDRILRAAVGQDPSRNPENRRSVMILDDETEIRVSLKFYLIGRGMDVTVAATAEEALSLLRSGRAKPNALLLDLDLPRLSGIEFLKLVRQMHPEIAVIVLTGIGSGSIQEAVERLGVRQFLHKPASLDTIEQALHKAFSA